MTVGNPSVHCSSCATHYLIFSVFTFLYSKTFPGFSTLAEVRVFSMTRSVYEVFLLTLSCTPWDVLPAAGTADLWVTMQFACNYVPPSRTRGHSHLPGEHGTLSAPSAVSGERGGPQPVRRELRADSRLGAVPPPCLCPLACDAGRLPCVCRCPAALPWPACLRREGAVAPLQRLGAGGDPSLAREARTARGLLYPRLRLHQMAAWGLQLLTATTSSGITARCRQCGHPSLVLSVCSEESSFALFGAVFCFQNFSKICPWMLLFHFVFVVSYCIRNCSYNFFRASTV